MATKVWVRSQGSWLVVWVMRPVKDCGEDDYDNDSETLACGCQS